MVILGIIIVVYVCIYISSFNDNNLNNYELCDYELYGMDSEEYLIEQVGEDYYNEHYR